MAYFPFFVEIEGQHCLVVGGGTVAFRKVSILIDYNPSIKVVAPELIQPLKEMGNKGLIQLEQRGFVKSDLKGADFVIVASSDEMLNRKIATECKNQKIPVNVVDVKEDCSFIFPALIKEEDITIGISTGGSSPTVAQYLKAQIKRSIPQGIGQLVTRIGTCRDMVKQRVSDSSLRMAIMKELAETGISSKSLPSREKIEELISRKLEENETFN